MNKGARALGEASPPQPARALLGRSKRMEAIVRRVGMASPSISMRKCAAARSQPSRSAVGARPSRVRASSAGSGANSKKSQPVVEHLLLLRIDPDEVSSADARKCIENLWSLQYQMGGVICSSAGESDPTKAKSGLEGDVSQYTHAVHFRFPARAQLDAFLSSPTVQKMQEEEIAENCVGAASLSFESSIPEDLFAIFRKGQDWEEGFDHAVVIECESEAEAGSRARGMRDFLEVNQPSMEECGVQQLTFGTAVTDGNKIGEYSSPFLPARRSSEPSPC